MTARTADSGRNPLVLDALLAAALTGLSIVTLLAGARDIGSYAPESVVLLFLQTIPLVFLRMAPVPVFLVTSVALAGHAFQAQESLNATLGPLIALFAVADRYDRRRSAVAGVALGVMMGAIIAYKAGLPRSLGSLVQSELAVLVAWTLGTWARERRRYVGTVEERASRAEHEREERAHRAVAEERERIARELHDIVTHHVSVIVIQAGAARRALQRRPEDAAQAIDAIDATGRLALADMRRMLGILGTTPAAPSVPSEATAETPGLEPLPRLDRLGQLIESVRAAGLPVELTVEGERRPLDPGVELSAYRIVQEALTNTLKHAHGARARVTVRYEPGALEVRVADDGSAAAPTTPVEGGGRGLVGMRERVALFGGTLEAGPDGAGFRIAARLPLDARPSSA